MQAVIIAIRLASYLGIAILIVALAFKFREVCTLALLRRPLGAASDCSTLHAGSA